MSTEGSAPAGATVEAVVEAPTAAAGAGRHPPPAKVKKVRHFYGIAPKILSREIVPICHRKSHRLSPPTRSDFRLCHHQTGGAMVVCHLLTGEAPLYGACRSWRAMRPVG